MFLNFRHFPHLRHRTDVPRNKSDEKSSTNAASSFESYTVGSPQFKVIPNSTFSKQDELPRLPIPTLDETLAKYLDSLKPLLNEEEFQKSKLAVEKFATKGGLGEAVNSTNQITWKQLKVLISASK